MAKEGQVTCILGPNGAGKTTLMFTLAGILKPASGSVKFDGIEIAGLGAPKVLQSGLSLVPEKPAGFSLDVSARQYDGRGLLASQVKNAMRSKMIWKNCMRDFQCSNNVKSKMQERYQVEEQQMLALARALMSRPKMLLLDEPSVGLAPKIIDEIFAIITQVKSEGMSIVLVEQNAVKALQVADHFYFLDQGRVSFNGNPNELENEDVIRRALSWTIAKRIETKWNFCKHQLMAFCLGRHMLCWL